MEFDPFRFAELKLMDRIVILSRISDADTVEVRNITHFNGLYMGNTSQYRNSVHEIDFSDLE